MSMDGFPFFYVFGLGKGFLSWFSCFGALEGNDYYIGFRVHDFSGFWLCLGGGGNSCCLAFEKMWKIRDLFQVIFKLYMGGVLGFPFGLAGFCLLHFWWIILDLG